MGAWIRHLVKQGNIVIYPRYQTNIFTPSASKFARNSAIAIQDALEVLQKDGHTTPDTTHFTLVGHSYGGVISANLAANYEVLGIPKPTVAMLCSPGSGPLSGGVLKNYEKLPNDLKLLVIVTENDQVVGDKFGKLVFETAPQVKHRNYIVQKADLHSSEEYIKAGHNETYALDMEFDAGIRNMTIKRALMTAREDHADYYCYWKLLDALMDYDQTGINYEFAFNQEAPQVNMGTWSDGSKILPLEVLLP